MATFEDRETTASRSIYWQKYYCLQAVRASPVSRVSRQNLLQWFCDITVQREPRLQHVLLKTNSVAFSPRANSTD
jgi:hypothetical protein